MYVHFLIQCFCFSKYIIWSATLWLYFNETTILHSIRYKQKNWMGKVNIQQLVSYRIFLFLWYYRPPNKGKKGEAWGPCPLLFLKLYFAKNVFLEIRFCIIFQGIQNFFGFDTPRILSGALYVVWKGKTVLIWLALTMDIPLTHISSWL